MKKVIAGIALVVMCMSVCVGQAKAEESASIQSDDALAYLSLDIDKTRGWIAQIKAGYQWNIFKKVGMEFRNPATPGSQYRGVTDRSFTKNGGAGSISLGYNFGPRFPLTVGVEFGIGPSGKLDLSGTDNAGNSFTSRQRINVYTLDLGADYEFKNCSRWTPFIGASAGVAFIGNKANASVTTGGQTFTGNYGKKHHYNLMAGAQAGVRYAVNQCVTLSLYGSYDYLGQISGRDFTLTTAGGGNTLEARTKKITAHSLAVKAGLKIAF